MENIKTMLLEDSHRWQDPKYCGLVVVHPDMVEDVVSMICFEFPEEVATLKVGFWDNITFKRGGTLTVTHMDSPEGSHRKAEHNHAGMEYTSIMFSLLFCGNGRDLHTIHTLTCGENINCMAYMMSRLRSGSVHASKFVIM